MIQRDALPLPFDGEQRPAFLDAVHAEAERARAFASVTVARPAPAPGPNASVGITTCEQNPWETIHILANGDAVVCEVQDRVVMGNLARQSLAEVWHGARYREFREQYLNGTAPACRSCVWRKTSPITAGSITPAGAVLATGARLVYAC